MWVTGLHAAPGQISRLGQFWPSEGRSLLKAKKSSAQAPLKRPECTLRSVVLSTPAPVGRYVMNRMVHEAVVRA